MKKTSRAFTLFEMVVVVAIFVLLAGGIYATVNAAVRATATLTEENLQIQRVNAFVSLLRRTFHNLPANAVFSGGIREEGGDGFAEITLRDAPGVFAWGMGGPSAGTALLSARKRLGGGREISLMLLPGSLGEMERRDALERGNRHCQPQDHAERRKHPRQKRRHVPEGVDVTAVAYAWVRCRVVSGVPR